MGNYATPVQQETLLDSVENNSNNFEQNKQIVSFFHFFMLNRHDKDRHKAKYVLDSKPENDFMEKDESY